MSKEVSRDENVMGGAACFTGTRVQVATLFIYLKSGGLEQFLADYPSVSRDAAVAVIGNWISPLPDGLPVGQVAYATYERNDGSRVTTAMVINGSYKIGGDWHYDLHQIRDHEPAFPGEPLGPSCRPGEMFES